MGLSLAPPVPIFTTPSNKSGTSQSLGASLQSSLSLHLRYDDSISQQMLSFSKSFTVFVACSTKFTQNYVMLLNIDHACAVHFLLEGKLSSSLSVEGCVFVDGVLRAQNVRCSKRVLEKPEIGTD